MSTKVAVVIPNHKDELNEFEKISLAQCRKVLSRYPLIHVVPAGQNFSYIKPGEHVAEFPAHYFQSLHGYNILSVSPLFYETFADFDYILIYQLDAFVFYDALKEFCALGYDYIGAPWPRYICVNLRVNGKVPRVGNGGFCLRKVKACRNLVEQANIPPNWANKIGCLDDDAFFAKCGALEDVDFHVAPVEVANLFAVEWYSARHVKRFGLPFGCHGWHKFSADFYVELFARYGYDLRPLRDRMSEDDLVNKQIFFVDFALKRLLRAVERGQSILNYLPTKSFASIRVIRSPQTIKFLSQLLTEENSLTDEIHIYDESTWTNLLRNVQAENLPHLLIVDYYDVSLIKALERGGLRYGEHVISFQREYMSRCEEIFHALGR